MREVDSPSVGRSIPAERLAYYERLSGESFSPLWEVLRAISPPEPIPSLRPQCWRWSTLRKLLREAGGLLTADEALRRALVLENRSLPIHARSTNTLTAAVQLVRPGEVAPAHRHTQLAVRFVLESDGGFTTVDGERTAMKPGDFVITPPWTFHDHGNDGPGDLVFLDVTDGPIGTFFGSGFSELHRSKAQIVERPIGTSLARYGSGLLPLVPRSPYGLVTPVFNYPYARTRDALLAEARNAQADPHLGVTLRFANPLDGEWATPTVANWMVYLPPGFSTRPIRSTDASLLAVGEGEVAVEVGETTFELGCHDFLAVPNWTWKRFTAGPAGAVLFMASDRSAQEKLGLWREQRAE